MERLDSPATKKIRKQDEEERERGEEEETLFIYPCDRWAKTGYLPPAYNVAYVMIRYTSAAYVYQITLREFGC